MDWWEGKVVLSSCIVNYRTFSTEEIIKLKNTYGEQNIDKPSAQNSLSYEDFGTDKDDGKPVICDWKDFKSEKDILEIQAKQKEIFESKKDELFKNYCTSFSEAFERSQLKKELIEDEVNDLKLIMYDDKENVPLVGFYEDFITGDMKDKWEGLDSEIPIYTKIRNRWLFIEEELIDIRAYINNTCKHGAINDYSYIHSPRFLYQPVYIINAPQITAQAIFDYYEWLMKLNNKLKNDADIEPPTSHEIRIKNVIADITKYGFFELPLVACLKDENKTKLVGLIFSNKLPYSIAMFSHLEFITYIERKYFATREESSCKIAEWLNVEKSGRSVRGNLSVLVKNSPDDKARYTAHLHKENVKKDYNQLK